MDGLVSLLRVLAIFLDPLQDPSAVWVSQFNKRMGCPEAGKYYLIILFYLLQIVGLGLWLDRILSSF